MHSPELGHRCPKCGTQLLCTIEDGSCEGNATCSSCVRGSEYERLRRQESEPLFDHREDISDHAAECECPSCEDAKDYPEDYIVENGRPAFGDFGPRKVN